MNLWIILLLLLFTNGFGCNNCGCDNDNECNDICSDCRETYDNNCECESSTRYNDDCGCDGRIPFVPFASTCGCNQKN